MDGQLIRRTRPVHFQRYDWACADDQVSFKRVLLSFESYLQKDLGLKVSLAADPEGLFEICLGCVGLLKATLFDAAKACLNQGATTVTREVIESKAMSIVEREELFREIREGLNFFHEPSEKRQALREALGLTVISKTSPESACTPSSAIARKANHRVGKRKPVRDPVGLPMEMSI
jgi:hypothetical protein